MSEATAAPDTHLSNDDPALVEARAQGMDEKDVVLAEEHPRPALVIVMGTCGSGKSLIGSLISQRLSVPFIDGDDLHPKSNVAKMSAGHPLTDADRLPWLAVIRSTAERICKEQWEGARPENARRPTCIIACSALKKKYRDILRGEPAPADDGGDGQAKPPSPSNLPNKAHPNAHVPASDALDVYFVYLKGSKALLAQRMRERKGHFMGVKMLESQWETLEEPSNEGEEECTIVVGIDQKPDEVAREAESGLRERAGV